MIFRNRRLLLGVLACVGAFFVMRGVFSSQTLITPCNVERLESLGARPFESALWKSDESVRTSMLYSLTTRLLAEQWSLKELSEQLGPSTEYMMTPDSRGYRVPPRVLEVFPADHGRVQVHMWPKVPTPGFRVSADVWPGKCLW